jgi:YD repeat-containing protein
MAETIMQDTMLPTTKRILSLIASSDRPAGGRKVTRDAATRFMMRCLLLLAAITALVGAPTQALAQNSSNGPAYSTAGSGWVTLYADWGAVSPKGPFSAGACESFAARFCAMVASPASCAYKSSTPINPANIGSGFRAEAACTFHIEPNDGAHDPYDRGEPIYQYCNGGTVVQPNGDCLCPKGTHWGYSGAFGHNACVSDCPNGEPPNELGVCTARPQAQNNGPAATCCGNPINPAAGIKYQQQTFLSSIKPGGARIEATYNSPVVDGVNGTTYSGVFGSGWSAPWDRVIKVVAGDPAASYAPAAVMVRRADGKVYAFQAPASPVAVNGAIGWVSGANISDRLESLVNAGGSAIGWRYTTASGEFVEIYDIEGRLLTSTNRQGQTEKFTYADGVGGVLYSAASGTGASPLGYVAPACNPPTDWFYRVSASNILVGQVPAPGQMLCASDPYGRQVQLRFNSKSQLVAVADPGGNVYGFEYDGASGGCVSAGDGGCGKGNLTKVTYPDGAARLYYSNELSLINGGTACSGLTPAGSGLGPFPNHLTGLVDENSNRYATWSYDCQGRATSSEHNGGVAKVVLAYDAPAAGQTTVTDYVGPSAAPVTTTRVYGFANILGVIKNTGIIDPATSQPAPCAGCGGAATREYDANANVTGIKDWNGNKSCSTYDTARNLETRRVEGLGSAASCAAYATGTPALTGVQRMTSTQWSTDWRLPVSVAEPLRITTYTYGAPNATNPGDRGNVLTKTVQATTDTTGALGFAAALTGTPRTWTYAYDANGSVLTVNGPRTDVADITTYTYYANSDADFGKRGNVATVANALGQTSQITAYNALGQPLTVVDPNGLSTEITYDSRQRLSSRDVGGEVTRYTYDGIGQLTQTTLPDGSSISYTYDAAQRLTAVQDNLGNKITYTLDLLGNRIKEDITDPSNQLAQTRSRVYDALNRLQKDIGALNQTTQYAYDAQGNLTTVTDPLNRVTTNAYDALNRLASMTQPAPAAGQSQPVIGYAYNGLDQLTQVTDPRSLVTSYAYDGLGNMNTQVSPDTGTTSNTYDTAGNLLTSTDAKSQITTYTYDALNRVTSLTYNQATGTQLKTVAYTYDQGTNGIGRLTQVTETAANGSTILQSTQYAYDQRGHLTSETRNLAGISYVTGYSYDPPTGRLLAMTYPSGRSLSYSYDSVGRIAQISTTAPVAQGGQTQLLVTGISYHPFGGIKSYTRGNNRTVTRSYDQDGRIASYTLGGTTFTVGYDNASRITSLLDTTNAANSNGYGYDNLDRLTSASVPSTSYGYSYDATGNRLSRSSGSATELTTVDTASNRITQVAGSTTRPYTYDPNGSTTADGNNSYTYDPRGRLVSSTSSIGNTTYQIGANGQRVRKTSTLGDTVFHYDASGKLIMETTAAGVVKKEYLYLLDIPVAVTAQ